MPVNSRPRPCQHCSNAPNSCSPQPRMTLKKSEPCSTTSARLPGSPGALPVAAILQIRRTNSAKVAAILQSDIIAELERLDVAVVDRAIFEKVFTVGRRRAIQLMHQFDGQQVGRTFIIDRRRLLDRLSAARSDASFDYEQTRRLKVVEELDRLRKLSPGRGVRIPVQPNVRDQRLADLPPGIHLRPGELRMEFSGTEDLLRQLFELSQAILNDYRRFEEIIEGRETGATFAARQ
jgi:hypothetical protein